MKKVLVVDDSTVVRNGLAMLLNGRNYWVKTCGTVKDACDAVKDGSMPDVVLLDFFLPDGNGLDVVEYIRSRPGGSAPYVMICTAATPDYMEQYREKLNQLVVGLMFKPFEPDNAMEAIDRLAFPDTQGRPAEMVHNRRRNEP